MTAQETFDQLVRDSVAPALKSLGFKRTRTTFHRAVGANWQVVNLQRSQFSTAASLKFTANLAVALDLLRDGLHDWDDGKRPPEHRCHFRTRIGSLLTGQDVWWELSPRSDVAALGETITEAVLRYGLPWLDSYSSPERAWPAHKDNLRELGWLELQPLGRLVSKLGLTEASEAVEAERERRESELQARRAKGGLDDS